MTFSHREGGLTINWSEYRDEFRVCEQYAYFQHPAVTALPERSRRAMEQFLDDMARHGCLHEREWNRTLESIRDTVAVLLGVDAEEVAFVKNTSHGLSLLAESLPLEPGDAVAVPEGEFPANVYPWMNLQRRGVSVQRIPVREGRFGVDELRQTLTSDTRVVSVSSVQFSTGFRADLKELGEVCKRRKIHFIVDGIQSVGWDPLDLGELPVDALVADGHKWMCGPEGAGVLYVSELLQADLEPVNVGWRSVEDAFNFDRESFQLRTDAAVFEEGSPNTVGLVGLGASLELLREIGLGAIRTRDLDLAGSLSDQLADRDFHMPRRGWEPRHQSPIIVASHPEVDAQRLAEHGRDRDIQMSVRGGRIRLGLHFYNNREDLRKLVDALDEVL